jgi:branched-chain amino acid transport system substrate-binding protein
MIFKAFTGISIMILWLLMGGGMSTTNTLSSYVPKNHQPEYSTGYNGESGDEKIGIGLLLPKAPEKDPLAQAAKEGAELAVLVANQSGGYQGTPFDLHIRTADGLWGAGSKESVKFVYEDEVLAILTAVDGRNAHLAEQVATKSQIVQVATRATDETLSQAFVPWFFRIVPNDRQQAQVLIDEILHRQGIREVCLIHEDVYDQRKAAETFIKLSEKEGLNVREMIAQDSLVMQPFSPVISSVPKALVVSGTYDWAKPLLEKIKKTYQDIQIFGLLSMAADGKIGSEYTAEIEGGIFVASRFCYTTSGQAFKKSFIEKYGHMPSPAASFAFDGASLLIEAIRLAGPEREKIREELTQIKFTPGITGPIEFDEHGNRIAPVFMIRMIKGHPVILHP